MTINNLPPVLSGESFQCVFGDLGSGELTPLSGNMYSCRVPNIPSFTGEGEGVCGGGYDTKYYSTGVILFHATETIAHT